MKIIYNDIIPVKGFKAINLFFKILIYLLVINVFTFLIMGYDKHEAKKGHWRISEQTLFTLVIIGGSIGGILGMFTFRHKTKKLKFTLGLPTILITEIGIVVYLLIKYKM